MSRLKRTDDAQIQRTYTQLTLLGFLLHTAQAVIFFIMSCPIPAVYNCVSVIFYALMIYMTRHQMYRLTVCSVHIETCLFAIFCIVSCGWGTGISLYLLAMSSLVYFCPFSHKIVPYLFSFAELAVFVALRIYTYYYEPLYAGFPASAEIVYYIFNALACFYIILFAAFSSNISAMVTNIRLRSENRNLSEIANSDFLTALPSRRAFLQRVKTLPSHTHVVAAIGDLDDFKSINDSFGHSCGDYVLRTVGQLISGGCGKHIMPCRWGGEEFVILFYDCSLNEALTWLHSLRARISSYVFEHEQQIMNVTITFGAYPGMLREGVEQLIDEADKYLYKGKQNGKNCVSSPL